MAIARGAGTEIIRNVGFNVVDDAWQTLIFGVQHHIYTVLSIIIYAVAPDTNGNYIRCRLEGYDALSGTTNFSLYLFQQDMQQYETYVWNDKFSFNGAEPANFTGPMDDATKQDAIADQESGVAQYLFCNSTNAADSYRVVITFIDQNNA